MSSLPAAVLWDLDGTLIDTEPYWIACEHELVAQFGGRWTEADAHSIVGFDLLDSARVIRDRGGVNLPPAEIVERLCTGVVERIRRAMPWRPGARELLVALGRAGVPCALVTMSWRSITDEVLAQLPAGTFRAVITGDAVMNGKPHPEPYRRAAEELGVDPLSCVAIEDSPTGVASAEAAGCVVVAVPNLVPIAPARHRVLLPSLVGVTPEQLGDIVETTPPPVAPADFRPARPGRPQPVYDGGDDLPPARPRLPPGVDQRAWAGGAGGRRPVLLAAAVVLVLGLAAVWWFALRGDEEPFRPGAFRVHTWVPPWELDEHVDEFAANATLFHQVSPFWYQVSGITSIGLYDDTPEEAAAAVLRDARSRGVPLVASLYDRTAPGAMAAILADPASRATHIDAIMSFVTTNDFQGVDINYERFAFDDGKATWTATRPNWVTFIEELGARLHAEGRLLTVSVPPVYDDGQTDDSGYWVYDYGGIVDHVDAIRMMAYDFSVAAPGPIAPLDWISDKVIPGGVEAAGGPDKLVLGIPLYGRNWVIATTGDCPASAVGTQSPRLDAIDDLIERRDGRPVYDQTTDEWTFTYQLEVTDGAKTCTQTREVHYGDAASVRHRMQLSVDTGLLGVALFAFGYQNGDVFDAIVEIDATLVTTIPDDATTVAPTVAPTTAAPTVAAPTTVAPTAAAPTTVAPTTVAATTTTAP